MAGKMVFGLLCAVVLFVGCSSSNKQASSSFYPDIGKHTAGWSSPVAHGTATKTQANGFAACQECHADDFSGGVSAVSCKSCHTVNAPHAPAPWIGGSWTHTDTNPANAPICAQCHANAANTSLPQPTPPALAGTAPGCFNNTLCHAQMGHPTGWSDPAQHGVAAKSAPTSTGGFALCETCHGTDFSNGIAQVSCFTCHGGSGPHPTSWVTGSYTHTTTDTGNASVCALCHTNGANSPIAPPSPPAAAGTAPGCFNSTLCHATPTCGSCHGIPPSGTAFPNVAGGHAVHTGLGSYITCNTCHAGAGYGTANHQNGTVDVSTDPVYNAKSGAAAYNASTVTCSNISCHGGQTTPNWQTGAIDVNTQCTLCHASGTAQYNGYYSGHHSTHVSGEGFACTVCHDTTKLAVNHFTSLNTLFTEATASATTKSALNFNGTTCNPSAGGLTGCHSSHTW